mmetsp:Transcript_27095/g.59195  ORF Transcript_27095/g.59195 Transcript_27095/m.59195 type:complete len:337 (-) Transcript_27095:669-1679(-)
MSGQWHLPKVEGLAPSPRGGHACVAVGTKVVVFGGSDRAPLTFDDLWVLETAHDQFEWTRISPSISPGCQIAARSGATLTLIRDKIYMFGGQEPVSETRFGDLKCLDTNTWEWSNVETRGGPPPARHSHCAGCLADQCLLVYGGSGHQGTLSDVWLFNVDQGSWSRPSVSGQHPAGREMHSGVMVDDTTMLVYGGRSSDGRILCDAAVLDAKQMKWTATEFTPFQRCAHVSIALSASDDQAGTSSSGHAVLIYGGYSGEAVEGDILKIDSKTLEIEIVRRGPRESDKPGSVPQTRFAHAGACIPWPGSISQKQALLVVGGVNPADDLNDVAVWIPA